MNSSPETITRTYNAVACPFCGMHCDDLSVKASGHQLQVTNTDCPNATNGFERKLPKDLSPKIDGESSTLNEAVKKAATILKKAPRTLFSGLATDVTGIRQILQTADKTNGAVDHMYAEGYLRNIKTLSDKGWITTTLTEIRNRADLIIFAGTDATEHARFYERVIWQKDALFVKPNEREIVYLGKGLKTGLGINPDGKKPLNIRNDTAQLSETINALKAILSGVELQSKNAGGAKISDLKKLAGKIEQAKYGVIVWSPGSLNFPHSELAIGAINDLIRQLNETQRFAGFSLGGHDGAASVMSTSAWQTGFPIRLGFEKGVPNYNPDHNGTDEILSTQQADALFWVSSITANRLPPDASIPTVVIGEPGMKLNKPVDVFIPVGTPGVDHSGTMVRVDSVVSLPMQKLRDPGLPSVREVFEKIYQQL